MNALKICNTFMLNVENHYEKKKSCKRSVNQNTFNYYYNHL